MKKATIMNFQKTVLFAALAAMVIFVTSCSKDKDNNPNPDPNDSVTVEDSITTHLLTDLYGKGYVNNGDTTDGYVLINLSTGDIVAPEDSNSTKWDIGFYDAGAESASDVILNSSIHGPGTVEGQIVDEKYEDVTEAPEEGYLQDVEKDTTINIGPHPVQIDIVDVFTNGIYYTGGPRHVIIPNENETWIIHTNDDKYVKLRVITIYKGNPGKDNPDFTAFDEGVERGYYTIEWTIQESGSRNLEE